MRQDCRKRVSKALGRPITDQEVAAIDRGMRRSMRHLAQTNPDWKGMSREERLIAAGDHAGEQFVQAPAPVQPKQRISPLANLVTPDDALNQQAQPAPTFYSALGRFVENHKQAKASADQWKGIIAKAPGIKAEEIEWTGVNEWLDAQEGSVTREDLAAFLEGNGVQVEEVAKRPDGFSDPEANAQLQRELLPLIEEQQSLSEDMHQSAEAPTPDQINRMDELDRQIENLEMLRDSETAEDETRWGEYTLPGGENYTELLLTLPDAPVSGALKTFIDKMTAKYGDRAVFEMTGDEQTERRRLEAEAPRGNPYDSSHWEEPNVLAHVRFKERVTSDGKRTLALEEIQSDWHQDGRKQGYANPAEKAALNEKQKAIFDRQVLAEKRVLTALQHPSVTAQIERSGLEKEKNLLSDLNESGIDAALDKYKSYGSIALAVMRNPALPKDVATDLKEGWEERNAHFNEWLSVRRMMERDGVPNAPFKNNAWASLALKRMIRYAAENGFDSVSWIPGDVQNGAQVDAEDGRSDFYDKIIPNLANKLGKKYGARVETVGVDAGYKVVLENGKVVSDNQPTIASAEIIAGNFAGSKIEPRHKFYTLSITPELKAAALEQGFPLFQKTKNPSGWGPVTPPPNIPPVRLDLKAVRDFYGDEAVSNLPRDVRERAATTDSVESMLGVIDSVRDTLKGKRPRTLLGFLRSRKISGVADPDGELTRILEGAEGSRGVINNKSGMDLDYVREAAEEAGYITPTSEDGRTTIQDLLDAIEREVQGDPVYMPQDLERASQIKDAETWAEWLDENDVDIYAEDKAELTRQVENLISISQEGAVTPDQAAELFGFPTGEDLLNAMTEQGGREQAVRRETTRRFKEEFGDMYETGELQAEIDRAVQTELRARKADIELEALSRAVGVQAAKRYAKDMAQSSLEMMSIGELRKRHKGFRRSAETHGRNALSEAKKGNWTESMRAKRYEMVALQMYLEGEKRLEMADRIQKDLRKYETSKGRRDRIANDYLEKIDALLEAYELRVSKQGNAEKQRRLSALEWVTQMKDEGREAEIAPEAELLAAAANDKRFVDLRIDEAEYLHATIKNIAHLGRTKERLLNDQEKRKFNAVIDEMVDRMDETGALPGVTRDRSPTRTVSERVVDALREGHSWLMRPEHQARSLDGGEQGPVWQAIFRPMVEASDVETRMMRESTDLYREAWGKFTRKERHRMMSVAVSVPELAGLGKRFTRMDIISIALNWGVQYNRDVLLEGYGWNSDQVEAVLHRVLTDKEWSFVEDIWKIAGMYKDEAFSLEKEMTGVEPKAVAGVDFTLPSGRVIEGKYYHIQYDGNQIGEASRRQNRDDAAQDLSQHRNNRARAQTKNGGLIERVGSGGRPVKLGLSVFEKGLSETIHDIAFRKAIIDVGRVVSDSRFADMYQDVAGLENYRQLDTWLKDIAKPPTDPMGPIVRAFAHVRRNVPLAVMGMKVGTALIQPTGILAAMPMVGHRRLAWAVAKAFANPSKSIYGSWQDVSEKSEFMRDRIAGYERDVRETTTALTKGGMTDWMRRNAFVFINGMDVAVSTPVWIAAYSRAADGKVEGIASGDEDAAILWADGVIRRTQTAGKMQDLSRFQRGGEFQKQISMIFSYFNNLYALSAQQTMDMRRGQMTKTAWAYQMTILFVAIPLFAELFAGRLFPDDDDDETLEGNIGQAVVSNFAGMFPGIRDAVALNLKPEFGYRMSPTAKFIEDTGATLGLPFRLALDEDKELTEYDVKRAVNAAGAMTGIPSAQINITGDYIVDVLQGNEDPAEDPLDAASEALVRNTR